MTFVHVMIIFRYTSCIHYFVTTETILTEGKIMSKKNTSASLRLTTDLFLKIDELAKKNDRPISFVIRKVIEAAEQKGKLEEFFLHKPDLDKAA